jgi:hypothetical protein
MEQSMSSRTFTREEIDKLLTNWQDKRALASANVVELMDLPTFKILTGTGGFKKQQLTGVTETRATPALKALSELWGLFANLGKVLDSAQEKHDALPRWPKATQLDEIGELLTGPSIRVTVKLPFAERTLLSAGEVSSGVTIDRVMDMMTTAYGEGKAIVLEVSSATSLLTKQLNGSTAEVQNLRDLAVKLGEGSLPELDVVKTKVDQLSALIDSDPLGTQSGFADAVAPVIKLARDRVEGLKVIYDQVLVDMELARKTLTSLADTHTKAVAAEAERKLKIWLADERLLPVTPDAESVQALADWLARLEAKLAQNQWQPLRLGVANWSLQATKRLLACQEAASANLEPLNLRQQLRGYLDALKTKAQTYGRGEDEELAAIEAKARALLYTRPTRIVEAESLVQQYAGNLR